MSTTEEPSASGHAPPELTLARFGELLAYLAFYGRDHEEEIVVRLGYPPVEYAAAAQAHRRALADAVSSDRPELLAGYYNAYDATLRALRARRPSLADARRAASLEPILSRRTAVARPSLAPLPHRVTPLEAALDVPSYLKPPERAIQPLAATAPAAVEVSTDETGMVDGRQILAGLRLPFVDVKDAAPFVPASPPSGAEDEHGETLMAPMSPEIRAALPFAASAPSDLARYVELTLALASGEPRDAVLARFGLDEAARERLSVDWADRFSREPQLRETFNRLVRERRR